MIHYYHVYSGDDDQITALNLVVLRSPDIERSVEFYSRLGLHFSPHKHGKGPEHYSAELPVHLLTVFLVFLSGFVILLT